MNSKELVFESCSELVNSPRTTPLAFKNKDTGDKVIQFKNYGNIYDKWDISNVNPSIAPKYWHWFVHTHIDKLISWVGAAPSSKK